MSIGLGLRLGLSGRQGKRGPKASFAAASAIRGIGVNPPTNNWTATQDGLTAPRSAALKAAGFNTVRVFVDDAAQMSAFQSGGQAALDAVVATHIARVRNAYNDGYAVVVSYIANPSSIRLDIQNPAGALYPRWMAACATMGAALWAAFGNAVLFEPMNEFSTRSAILGAGYPDYYDTFCPAVVAAIRAVAPNLWIGLQSTDFGVASFLPYFTNAGLIADPRVIFTFHGYDPGEFTHEGQSGQSTFGIEGLNWPILATVGGVTQAKADAATRVNASALSAPQKTAQITANNTTLDNLFTAGGIGSPSYPMGLLATAEAWRVTKGLPTSRLLCTEFGAVSTFNYDGTGGTTTEARAAYEKMWRTQMEAYGYGWSVYQSLGDLNHFQQTSVTVQGDVLIPDLTLALARPGVQSIPSWASAYGQVGGADPIYAADFVNNRYWLAKTETADLRLAVDFTRSTARSALNNTGSWLAILASLAARTDLGLSIEPAFSGPTITVAKAPATTAAASTTFPSGLQNFGAVANYTCALVDDTAALAASGLAELVPAGVVYEISNTTGSTKFLQFQGGAINAVAQVGSWFARKISGAGTIQLAKTSAGTNKQPVPIAATYSRYTFTDTGTGAMEVSIPTGVVFRFVVPMLEYKAATPASSPFLGSARAADVASPTSFSGVPTAGTIKVDTGSGLTTTTFAALTTLLNGGGVTVKAIVAWP